MYNTSEKFGFIISKKITRSSFYCCNIGVEYKVTFNIFRTFILDKMITKLTLPWTYIFFHLCVKKFHFSFAVWMVMIVSNMIILAFIMTEHTFYRITIIMLPNVLDKNFSLPFHLTFSVSMSTLHKVWKFRC